MKISVIMPVKNREKEISEAIQSVIDQSFSDWELIVVDDHSEDQTKQKILNFQDARIKYYFLTESTGPGAGRDFGIKKAEGEIIVLADSDDVNYPDRFQLIIDVFLKKSDVDIVYGRSNRSDPDGVVSPRPTTKFDVALLRCYNLISNVTAAFKKQRYLESQGYDQTLKTSEDYDLWLTFLEKGYHFVFIDQPLVLQKIHPQSVTSKTDYQKRKANLTYVRQKHHLSTPNFEEVKKLVQNQDLLDFISTPGAIDFWFS